MKKILYFGFVFLALAGLFAISPPPASAQTSRDKLIQDSRCQAGDTSSCVGISCDPAAPITPRTPPECVQAAQGQCTDMNCNVINKYLNPFINFLSIMVGIAVVIGLILGGIQYAGSAGDPQKVSNAKDRIRNSIVALIVFFFLYALLQFLIPGKGLLVG